MTVGLTHELDAPANLFGAPKLDLSIEQIDEGEAMAAGCAGTFGTLGSATGTAGTFGTFGCYAIP